MSTRHLLAVDDDADVRKLMADILGREGYRVTTCSGAEELWAAFAQEPADLVLLDVRMPGEDGFSIAKKVRAVSNMGIIMVSAMGETVDKVVGLEVGADDYVTKPFDRRELVARVRSVLRRRSTGEGAPPLASRIDKIAETLDDVSRRVQRIDDETHRIDQEALHIEYMLRPKRADICAQCGSPLVAHRAEKGVLQICDACGWSQFTEDED
jgi:DNA-binding response OmpR family regulator